MSEELAAAEAHVWSFRLDAPDTRLHALAETLSDGERARLAACGTDSARHRFIVSRGTLRSVLARYTGAAPASLVLLEGETGKPALEGGALHFSLSHSRGTAVIAVARTGIGVDIEHERELPHLERIARRLLHPDTVAALERLDDAARGRAFLDAWTLREAHVKAVGGGLFRTPDLVPFDPATPLDGRPRPIRARDGSRWSVARFAPAAGARATAVARGTVDTLRIVDTATAERLIAGMP
jgi:4'-phosphopantetheinyl transferase